MRMVTVVGARPQFVKAAVISRFLRSLDDSAPVDEVLIHTGQHYDDLMSDVFFREIGIPSPKHNLGVGSGAPADQLGEMLSRLGKVVAEEAPDVLLVYGDTNSTLAAAIVAAQQNVPVVHVEAGERIWRRRQVPEELNRVLCDNIAHRCLCATERAIHYLRREGMPPERVRFVGDPMFDVFCWAREDLDHRASITPEALGLEPGGYHLATIHRAENTKTPKTYCDLLDALDRASLPVVLPVHPRAKKLLETAQYEPRGGLKLIDPLGYFDFLRLLLDCKRCVTDSGGVTREAFFAQKPCISPMTNIWWPQVIEAGWALATGPDLEALSEAVESFTPTTAAPTGLFGDGKSARRIIDEVVSLVEEAEREGPWHPRGHLDQIPTPGPTRLCRPAYRELVGGLIERGYEFESFPRASDRLEDRAGTPFALLRHDIDIELAPAVAMAELERELGVTSTFFFMLRTDHYNPLSAAGTAQIRQIIEGGHHLGLHFDCAAYPELETTGAIAAAVAQEASLLENWFGVDVSAVSFHRPGARVLDGDPALSPGRRHTYEKLFTESIAYRSDSRGGFKHGWPLEDEAVQQRRPLHLLVHPIWWDDNPLSPFEVLQRSVQRKQAEFEASLAANCLVFRTGRFAEGSPS